MIYNKKEFGLGLVMMIAFLVVLALFFMPLYGGGKNGLDYLDNLYNSISKGSAHYIPGLYEGAAEFTGHDIDVTLALDTPEQAGQTALLYQAAGVEATADGANLTIKGGLDMILKSALDDAEVMYNNDGDAIQAKYGYDAKEALYNWWASLTAMDKALKKQKDFKAAAEVDHIIKKGVEASYNYYGIEGQSIADRVGMVTFSLAFYVVYTLWYGFAILFMFEGWGLKLSH